MNIILAIMLAQSLWSNLGEDEPVAPAAEAAVEAVAEESAPAAEAAVSESGEAQAQPGGEAEEEPAPVAEEPAGMQVQGGAGEAAPSEAPAGEGAEAAKSMVPNSVTITSDRTDYDRREGVIMFDSNVFVDNADYQMYADQLYVFLDGTNELKRIVAIGNVSITNETRVGSCAKAAYTKSVGKIVMYGDGKDVMATLADTGKRKSEVEGRKITFWIDSEQVEVEGSTVTLDAGGIGGKDGAKKLLGK